LTKDKKVADDQANMILWDDIINHEFDYIVALDSPSSSDLTYSHINSLLRISEQAKYLNQYLRKKENTRLILLSSVSVLGNVKIIYSHNEVQQNPDLYGTAKSIQEQILGFDLEQSRIIILRLPAVLVENAVVHFPSRLRDTLIKNETVTITNPQDNWNACLSILDLSNLIVDLVENFQTVHVVQYPHASDEISFLEVVNYMRLLLASESNIIVKDRIYNESGGVRLIKVPNRINTLSVANSLKQFCELTNQLF
jgi:nucleoside-diphosphate-sugar epimerase